MFSRFSVKKPYTVLVGVLLSIVLGVVSLMNMTTDLLPDMSFPYALIITTDVGASPEEIEKGITAPIEASMATTSNIKSINSMSYNSYSMVICEYEQVANMDSVVIEIQQKLDQLSGAWDDTVSAPMIMQIDPDMLPVMTAAVDVEGMTSIEVSEYVENELIPALESIEGVASASATGSIEEKVVVTLNQDKIDSLNDRVMKAIRNQFSDYEGEIEDGLNQLEQGKDALDDGKKQLEDGINEVLDKKDELYKTEEDLRKQLKELKEQKEQVTAIKAAVDKFIKSEEYKSLEQASATIEELQALIDSGMATDEMIEAYETAVAAVEAANAAIAEQFAGLSALGITVDEYTDLPTASAKLGKMLTQISTGIASIEEGLSQIEEGKIALDDALAALNANAVLAGITMSQSYADITNAIAQLESAKSELEGAKTDAESAADLNSILSMDTISGLLTAQNFDMPAGYAYDGDTQYLVRVGESVETIEELTDLVLMDLGMDGIETIRLSDVADIEKVDNSEEVYSIVNGNPSISISLEKQTGYSTGDVTDRILEKFDSLEAQNEKLNFTVLMDQGVYIDVIVDSVVENMIVGAILAILVLWVFLKDFRPTIVTALSIPLSVILSIVLMYFMDISLNIISMSGLVLGIGMLVDNSIVVIENIYRLRGEGYSIRKAAVEGASQVAGAIVASTLTTVCVYVPIIFTDGITKQLFVDLALTVAFTLGASLIVALTVVPAMSSFTLRRTKEIAHPWFDAVKGAYEKAIEFCLRFKVVVFVVAVALLVVSGAAALSRGMTFMDMNIETNQLSVTLSAKDEQVLDFEELVELSDEAVARIGEIEGVDTIGASIGGGTISSMMGGGSGDAVTMYVLLEEDSEVSLFDVADQIEEKTADMNCLIEANTTSMDMTAMMGSGLSIQIKGASVDKLQELAAEVAAIVTEVEGTVDVNDGLNNQSPQLAIIVDKEKAAEYGYTVAQVFQLVYSEMASNSSAATLTTDVKDYEIYLQTEEQSEVTLDDIKNITFTDVDEDGEEVEVPLTKICTMVENTTLSTINRSAQTRYLTVSCGIDEQHNVTLVSNEVKEQLAKLDIPAGYEIKMAGEDETINESMEQMMLMLTLAVIFIYLIMVAQFQSLLSPFIILFTIPLAFTGGFMALFIAGRELSIIAMLGFIMLSGLIVNNGIVLIDYINQRRQEGASKHDAIVEAGIVRLRPILMTALTTILAMSTSAVGMGQGSEIMQPMAITIIGGLLYGTLLTLFVIPCVYDAFNKEKSMVDEEDL